MPEWCGLKQARRRISALACVRAGHWQSYRLRKTIRCRRAISCLMVGAAIGLGSILTPYATGPSPIYYGSGYLPTVDYWRLGAIFGLIFLVLLVITGLLWMPVVLL